MVQLVVVFGVGVGVQVAWSGTREVILTVTGVPWTHFVVLLQYVSVSQSVETFSTQGVDMEALTMVLVQVVFEGIAVVEQTVEEGFDVERDVLEADEVEKQEAGVVQTVRVDE